MDVSHVLNTTDVLLDQKKKKKKLQHHMFPVPMSKFQGSFNSESRFFFFFLLKPSMWI